MRPLSLLIKPASGLCNMRCRYCFYADVAEHRETASYGIMTEDCAEDMIRRAFEYASGPVTFAFQGGEPTLAGIGYYRAFVDAVDRLNEKKLPVSYAMQTNGYELSDELCALLRDRRFLVGVSLDGQAAVHDAARIDAAGEGTFKRVNRSIAKLREYGIEFNILAVVTNAAAKNISSIYAYLRSRGYPCVQFIKHVDGFGDADDPSVWSLTPERYTNFLKTAFGYYYDDILAERYMSVREFDNFIMLAVGRDAECCGMNGVCPANLVIEADGGAYPCDFYVLDEWRMGNIRENSVEELLCSDAAARFRKRSFKIDEKCRTCRYFALCRGGCARHREPDGPDGLALNKYCESYREFFRWAEPKIAKLADMARKGQIRRKS
ncbi:MAG: SPASM domain-containing protein [Clostridia bacterium]|nr:SPASM domain-containing protein [Clostridia bacterium]